MWFCFRRDTFAEQRAQCRQFFRDTRQLCPYSSSETSMSLTVPKELTALRPSESARVHELIKCNRARH